MIKKISVYGAGSWGTALALQLARNGLDVLLWDIRPEHCQRLQSERCNNAYLPDLTFPDNLNCTDSLEKAVQFTDHHLVVIASVGIRPFLRNISDFWHPEKSILCATKGIEIGTGKLMHQLFSEELGDNCPYGIISGPTFATEVAKGFPTALTVASENNTFAHQVADAFKADTMKVYVSNDVTGVELGGAIKNVLAIAAGVSDGLGFGANARAALITRGLAEITRLATKIGADNKTMMGLAGLGDLVLTCTDNQSRNRQLGLAIGAGKTLETALEEIGQAVEGAKTSQSIHILAHQANVEMPICTEVHRVLYEGRSPEEAVKALLSRQTRNEY